MYASQPSEVILGIWSEVRTVGSGAAVITGPSSLSSTVLLGSSFSFRSVLIAVVGTWPVKDPPI